MSERIQRRAKKNAEARRQREQNARGRAEAAEERGDPMVARLHRQTADLQREAAEDSEALLEADRKIEGDQLDD